MILRDTPANRNVSDQLVQLFAALEASNPGEFVLKKDLLHQIPAWILDVKHDRRVASVERKCAKPILGYWDDCRNRNDGFSFKARPLSDLVDLILKHHAKPPAQASNALINKLKVIFSKLHLHIDGLVSTSLRVEFQDHGPNMVEVVVCYRGYMTIRFMVYEAGVVPDTKEPFVHRRGGNVPLVEYMAAIITKLDELHLEAF